MPCETFDSLALGSQITVYSLNPVHANTWQQPNAEFWGEAFQWSNGTWYNGGFARIVKEGRACGDALEVWVNNINLCFGASIGQPLEYIKFRFGEYGGNLNLIINGQLLNFANFEKIHGQVIDGAEVNLLDGGAGNDCGEIEFVGRINDHRRWGHLAIGGQELWIDDFCWE